MQAALRLAALSIVAGYVDAFGYRNLGGVFTANMTGNTVFLGIDLAAADWRGAATAALTIGAFGVGAVAACVVRYATGRASVPLALVAALLLLSHVLRLPMRAELVVLSWAMGMQGASVTRFGETRAHTVVVTGNLLMLADALVDRLLRRASRIAPPPALPAASWIAYGAGAALALIIADRIRLPMLPPSLMLLVVAASLARDEPNKQVAA